MTTQQRAELPDDEEVTAADRLIVESPTPTGLILIRTFGPEPGLMPMARRALAPPSAARNPDCYFVTIGARRHRLEFRRRRSARAPGRPAATIAWKRTSARSASTASTDGTAITSRSSA